MSEYRDITDVERELRVKWNEHIASAANHLLEAKTIAEQLTSSPRKSTRYNQTDHEWQSVLRLLDKFAGTE